MKDNLNAIKRKPSRIAVRNNIAGYAFIAIPILGFLLFVLVPLIFSIIVSFSDYEIMTKELTWTGLDNYKQAFNDQYFIKSLGVTFYSLIGLVVQIVVALLLAILLTVDIKGQPVFRAFFYVPSLCSSVAVTMVWKLLYDPGFGVLNSILTTIGLPAIGWLTDQNYAMLSVVIEGVWMGVGGGMIMYIAALKNVSRDLYEAADIDGAGTIKKFFKITLPTISPTTFYILITSFIGYMTDFTKFKVLTPTGGPNYSTRTTAFYIYQFIFGNGNDFAYATALAWILSIIIIALMGILFATAKKWVYYRN